MMFSLLLLGAVTSGVLAVPMPDGYALHERSDGLPTDWSDGKRLDPKASLPMRIGLTQRNLDEGHDLLMELSNPYSASYGKYLSAEDVHDMFAPSKESVDSVLAWLDSSGIASDRVSQSVNKQWLQFDADAEEAETLIRAEYHVYSHSDSGKSHLACREYHVPKNVQRHIDYITPGVKALEVKGVKPTGFGKRAPDSPPPDSPPPDSPPPDWAPPGDHIQRRHLSSCDAVMTPECIAALYNIPDGDKSVAGNELGIVQSLGDVYSQEDFDLFFKSVAPQIPTGTHPELRGIGDIADVPTTNVSNSGSESSLDFEVAYPIIWPQNTVLFQTESEGGFMDNLLSAIDGSYCSDTDDEGGEQCGIYKPTNVISISYGGAEAWWPIPAQHRQCNEYMKLGLQGVSILAASGNLGVQMNPHTLNGGCLGDDGKVFAPNVITTCPYVTAVGGTYLKPGAEVGVDDEVALDRRVIRSGGGFSNIFRRADYQSDAVEDYFSKVDLSYKFYESVDNSSFAENGGIYNRIGRAYPDVSAVGDNFLIFWKSNPIIFSGTSGATPVFAAVLNRINEERLAANKPTVGFVNPVLYSHPEVLNDITVGNNWGCGTDGFIAAPGWDPVTGLGTPNYPKMLELFMSLD